MIKKYIIDGNNVLGKIPELRSADKNDRQRSRERLAFMIDRYFTNKKTKVSLHLDGHPGDPIRTNKSKIIYSYSKSADYEIKKEINDSKNPRVIAVVSSDLNLIDFAKKNACKVIKSEEFVRILNKKDSDDETDRIAQIDKNEIKKIFGIDE
jgi:predicted RNA-binding protein with PIN domain